MPELLEELLLEVPPLAPLLELLLEEEELLLEEELLVPPEAAETHAQE